MKPGELRNIAKRYREAITRRIWDQWSAIGGGGFASESKPVTWAVDIEALILASSRLFDHEPRLREVVLAWTLTHEGLISIARLKRMQQDYGFGDVAIMADLAVTLLETNPSMRSWKSIAAWGKPGVIKESRPFRRRDLVARFQPNQVSCLFLKLRSLLGVGSRIEILFWMFYNGSATVSWIASETNWHRKTVQKTLNEMVLSGHVVEDHQGPYRRYGVVSLEWKAFFPKADLSKIWLAQHHLYEGVFEILQMLQRCGEEEIAEDAAKFLLIEALTKSYNSHQRARSYLVREMYSPVKLTEVVAHLLENIENNKNWPVNAFSVNPRHCQFE